MKESFDHYNKFKKRKEIENINSFGDNLSNTFNYELSSKISHELGSLVINSPGALMN